MPAIDNPAMRQSRLKGSTGVALALCLSAGPAIAAPVRLTTHDLPPYSFVDEQGKLAGVAVKRVECAMTRIQRAFTVTVYPWARAQKLVYAGDADGFFAASQSAERDALAQLSAEIAPRNGGGTC